MATVKAQQDIKDNGLDFKTFQSTQWQDFYDKKNKIDTAIYGDLNKDGLTDMVIVYQPINMTGKAPVNLRTLRVLFKGKEGMYKLMAESHLTKTDDGTDVFFENITIKKGILSIHHSFLYGGSTHRFRYQNKKFELIGVTHESGDDSYSKGIDYNLMTGNYIVTEKTKGKKPLIKTGVQQTKSLPVLNTYQMYSLKIAKFDL